MCRTTDRIKKKAIRCNPSRRSPMRPASSADDLLAAPVGRYLAGRSFVVWVQDRHRLGAFHFGRHEVVDEPALAALFALPLSSTLAPPYEVLYDLSAVEALDRRAFECFEVFLARGVDQLAHRTRRLAAVRPNGLPGAAFAGLFHDLIAPRFDAKLCGDRREAYEWLGLGHGAQRDERDEIESLRDAFLEPVLVRRVREAIAADIPAATLDRIANALAISPRTLQRQLADHGTSLRDEVACARIRAARAMLLDRDEKIEYIASLVGFRSPASFTTRFRAAVGESPSAFRALRTHRRAS
ncbi:MAG TPA: helix-turn-helix transcriptional regulator [Kofleriaceae bacterium]